MHTDPFSPIIARLFEHVQARPGQVALYEYSGKAVTFAQLWVQLQGAAAYLARRGVRRGERVLVLVPPGLGFIVINYALLYLGATPILIDPGIGFRAFLSCAKSMQPRYLIGSQKALILRRVFFDHFKHTEQSIDFETCLGRPAVEGLEVLGGAEDGAVLFTSGSTGPHKGVWVTQAQIAAQASSIQACYGIEPGEVDVPLLAAFALYNPLLGMTTVFPKIPKKPSELNPARVIALLERYQATNSFGSPVLWQKLADHCDSKKIRLQGLRRILTAGASLPPSLAQQLLSVAPNARIHSPYGATEALPVASIDDTLLLSKTARRTQMGGGTCVGRVLDGVQLRICPLSGFVGSDAEALPSGSIGAIWVQGPVVSPFYINAPLAGSLSKVQDAQGLCWHCMGDLGYQDAEGLLWFCGRIAESFRTVEGPFYTECSEAPFLVLPQVRRCALICLNKQGVLEPALVVQPRSWPWFFWQKRQLRAVLGAHAQLFETTRAVRQFFFVRDFPVDVRHNAKIHRLALARRINKSTS